VVEGGSAPLDARRGALPPLLFKISAPKIVLTVRQLELEHCLVLAAARERTGRPGNRSVAEMRGGYLMHGCAGQQEAQQKEKRPGPRPGRHPAPHISLSTKSAATSHGSLWRQRFQRQSPFRLPNLWASLESVQDSDCEVARGVPLGQWHTRRAAMGASHVLFALQQAVACRWRIPLLLIMKFLTSNEKKGGKNLSPIDSTAFIVINCIVLQVQVPVLVMSSRSKTRRIRTHICTSLLFPGRYLYSTVNCTECGNLSTGPKPCRECDIRP
jgi:hypothetical protein